MLGWYAMFLSDWGVGGRHYEQKGERVVELNVPQAP